MDLGLERTTPRHDDAGVSPGDEGGLHPGDVALAGVGAVVAPDIVAVFVVAFVVPAFAGSVLALDRVDADLDLTTAIRCRDLEGHEAAA